VKLFAVHLTTIAAFCHVLSIRREPIVRWKIILYILVSFSLFACRVVFLFAVLYGMGSLLLNRLTGKPTDEIKDGLWRAPLWLFGKIPNQATPSIEEESRWKEVWRILLALPFLTKCIGTLVLYARRQSHGAATHADQRVIELGCTANITALYWLADTLTLPPFSKRCDHHTRQNLSTLLAHKFVVNARALSTRVPSHPF
jgi:hypothetical protein